MSHRVFLQCAVVCVRISQEGIDTVYNQRASRVEDVGSLSSWWYNVLFLYTSATVLIAAQLSPSILSELSEASILDSWRKAMEVLEGYGAFGPSIRRLITTLRLIFDTVPHQYSRQRQQPLPIEIDVTSPSDQNQAYEGTASLHWPPCNSIGGDIAPLCESTGYPVHDSTNFPPSEDFWEFDGVFDPNDVSWLTTVPFDS